MTPRIRHTVATQRRLDNLRLLVEALGQREMLADEICDLLKFSPSGARKYIRDLREDGVIELARYVDGTATYIGLAVYTLTPDQERVRAFLAGLDQPRAPAPPNAKHRDRFAAAGAGRHFHIIADDTHYAVRVSRVQVFRDPLVAALFGPAASAAGGAEA
jgi:DNA-binding transcriptional ArsR family regulator